MPRFRRVERLARLWQRRETLLGFVAAVKEWMKVARPELVPAAQSWVDRIEAYLDNHRPVDVLFFEWERVIDCPPVHRC
jgi:acetolactate synthase regulatory subunit